MKIADFSEIPENAGRSNFQFSQHTHFLNEHDTVFQHPHFPQSLQHPHVAQEQYFP